ncbi:hypothetical protein J3R08_001922 [Micromonospora sp. HB375]|uniref:NACHT domain-containing protein n=1 Tax=unclassified Micromonospora TaxID=2617518 RepID=UPI001AE3E431|nr:MULTISPECIES: ATP-binding protein [unclassified Micromonospora]MBP1782072.1 hypothetical protein [Micromonospora sp. HB375]MDH6470852.1 hypothetical protein [Micromonospora sp. H404/HB375]
MAKVKDIGADFAMVREIVKSASGETPLINFVDKLFSVGLILSPAVLGQAAVPLLALFDMKSDMVKTVSDLARKVAGSGEDFLSRSQSLASAHWLITYTAFFSAASDSLGNAFNELGLTSGERKLILYRSSESSSMPVLIEDVSDEVDVRDYGSLPPVSLPHPAATFQAEADARLQAYGIMAKNLMRVLMELESWGKRKKDKKLKEAFENLPNLAVQYYFAQYLDLMLDFKDFFGWATLYEHQKTQEMVAGAAEDVIAHVALVQQTSSGIDLGMRGLAEAIRAISDSRAQSHTELEQVAQELALVHEEAVSARVINDVYAEANDAPVLTYPTKADAFVPQSYKTVRYLDSKCNLEDEQTWSGLPSKDDLGSFLVRYFSSPYSTQSPLIVLGHPGSGKSLLTELIAARLLPPAFNTVRIELRDIDPDTDIQSQIENQIRADTGRDINWSAYSSRLVDSPPLIILDGYDELLQSTGKVFASYLESVQRFQTREALMRRPVRIIVTSRITLIDKASIPLGSTIVRLMEFDRSRREKWISVWNRTNAAYFAGSGVKSFSIPDGSRLLHLAEQPLLLLMLAIYDSRENELGNSDLDQTMLYYSLLCRFIERERSKGEAGLLFKALRPDERKKLVEADLSRLGVAAIGMFNRRTVHTHRSELEADISYFAEGREVLSMSGALLSQADLLLGSFFFIHESKSKSGDPDDASQGVQAAFEFLHNTFGEFLAADFILRRLLQEAQVTSAFNSAEILEIKLREQLARPHDFWFGCLSFTGLHTRPVVFEMMREWLPHRLEADGLPRDEMIKCLRLIIDRQLFEVINRMPPSWFTAEIHDAPFGAFSHLGHLAVYSLNLVLLGALISKDGYEFTIKSTNSDPASDETSWISLVNIWRSWFSLDELLGVAAIIACTAQSDRVIVAARERLGSPSSRSKLEAMANLSFALADDVSHVVAALAVADAHGLSARQISALRTDQLKLGADLSLVTSARAAKSGTTPGGAWLEITRMRVLDARLRRQGPLPMALLAAYEVILSEKLSGSVLRDTHVMGPDGTSWLATLSRYEANVVVSAKSEFEPRWLDAVARNLRELDFDSSRPFLAPILRQLRVQHVDTPLSLIVNSLLKKVVRARLSCEASVELFLLCDASGAEAIEQADENLAGKLESWESLDHVPQDSLIDLVCALLRRSRQSPTRRRLRSVVDAALTGASSHRLAQGMSFGLYLAAYSVSSVGGRTAGGVIARAMASSPAIYQLYYRPSCLLALLRVAHARRDASLASAVILSEVRTHQGSEGLNGYLPKWLRHALKTFTEEDADRFLSVQQRRDVEWFVRSVGGSSMPWSSATAASTIRPRRARKAAAELDSGIS